MLIIELLKWKFPNENNLPALSGSINGNKDCKPWSVKNSPFRVHLELELRNCHRLCVISIQRAYNTSVTFSLCIRQYCREQLKNSAAFHILFAIPYSMIYDIVHN